MGSTDAGGIVLLNATVQVDGGADVVGILRQNTRSRHLQLSVHTRLVPVDPMR